MGTRNTGRVLPIVRIALIVAIGAGIAWNALQNAVGNVLALRAPDRALMFDPDNGAALAGLSTLQAASEQNGMGSAPALAADALRQGPVSAAAMRAVAVASSKAGQTERSIRQFRLAERMSRRDLATQMALIQLCVERNDVMCALSHYDIALTTSDANAAPLFPILTAALADPDIARHVVRYIQADRPWVTDFVSYAAAQGDAEAVARMMVAVGKASTDSRRRESEAVILGRLKAAEQWQPMRRLYGALEGSAALSSPKLGFDARTIDQRRLPVAWELANSGFVSTSFEAGRSKEYLLRLSLSGGAGNETVVARRIAFLSPGMSQVVGIHVAEVDADNNATIGFGLRCLEGAAPENDVTRRVVATKPGDYRWAVDIPAGCTTQEFRLLLNGGTGPGDVTMLIDRIVIDPRPTRKRV